MKTLFVLAATAISFIATAQSAEELNLEVDDVTLSGTLLVPANNFEGEVVLFFSGSGVTDRDGNSGSQFQNNSLKMLAEELAKAGFASFRFDKRSIPLLAANKIGSELSFDDFVADGKKWLNKLKSDSRFSKFYVLGHSQGSTISALVAADESVTKLISIAGPASPADEVILSQLEAQSPLLGSVAKPKLDSLKAGMLVAEPEPPLNALFKRENQSFMMSWFAYNPAELMASLSIPVLIVNGSTDLQVSVDDAKQLDDVVENAELLIIDGMNHVLKKAPEDRMKNMMVYSDPTKPLSDGLVDGIVAFLNRE